MDKSIQIKKLKTDGYLLVSHAFCEDEIREMRLKVLSSLHHMSNTRPTKTAFHISGFHKHLELEHFHQKISGNKQVISALKAIYGEGTIVSLGISDITINRSQDWHTDLLRGPYASFINPDFCWSRSAMPCLKVLVYLQDGDSLSVVPGSHFTPIDLSNDLNAIPNVNDDITMVSAKAGDVILMDIRLIHRGATEEQMQEKAIGIDSKILISTVFGEKSDPLARSIQQGQIKRLLDWEIRNPSSKI